MQAKNNELELVSGSLEQKTQEYQQAEKEYNDLTQKNEIERARSEGLATEVARLQGQVGTLEQAVTRANNLKDGLTGDVNRLEVAVSEGIALTPDKYSHEKRLAEVQQLKADLAKSPVVTPELMNRYTSLYQKELAIGNAREYFFARIPVRDRYGVVSQQWAEAVMNGNWSVYFRTLDGRQIGIYEKVVGSDPPHYEFRQFLPSSTEKQVEQEIIAARTPGYEEKINTLAQREVTMQGKTGVQRVFDSL